MKEKTKVGIFGLYCFAMGIYFLITMLDLSMMPMYPVLISTVAIFYWAGFESIRYMDYIEKSNLRGGE